MLALGLLIIGSIVVFLSWTENYGDSSVDVSGTFSNAITALRSGAYCVSGPGKAALHW